MDTLRHLRGLLLAVTVLLVAAACGEAPPGTGDAPGDPAEALDGDWRLLEGTGPDGPIPLVASHDVTLTVTLDDAEVGGTAACNGYGGSLTADDGRLQVSELFATEMACVEDGVMESEAAYLDALPRVTGFEVEGDRLVLLGDEVELTFVPRD